MSWALGVDAGGTALKAVLSHRTPDGWQVVGTGQAGSANPRQVGLPQAHLALLAAAQQAFSSTNTAFSPAHCAVVAGIAGVATPEDVERFVDYPHPFAALQVMSDAVLTRSAYFAGQPGILLVVGTGCIALAEDAQGQMSRRMGWGFPLEQGGGAWLGLEALRLALADLENAIPSELAGLLRLELGDPRAVMEWIRGKASGDYARFAPWVFAVDDPRLAALKQQWADLAQRLMAQLEWETGLARKGVWGGLATQLLQLWQPQGYQPPARTVLEEALERAQHLLLDTEKSQK